MGATMDYTETITDTPRRRARLGRWIRIFCHVARAALRPSALRPSATRPDPQEERMLLIARHRPPI